MEDVAFIAPNEFSTFTFRAEGDEFVPDIDLAVPPVTRWIKHKRTIIFVSRAAPFVYFVDIDSAVLWSLALPADSHPFDLALWQDWLFVAAGDKVLLAMRNWERGTEWKTLPTNKQIDGLAIHEGKLLAVDNIVTPKWVLIYDLPLSEAMTPSLVELSFFGDMDELSVAFYWDGKFVTLSQSFGMQGVGKHVRILSCASFEVLDHIYCFYYFEGGGFYPRWELGFPPLLDAKNLVAYRDVLVISGGLHGLMATCLSAEPRPPSKNWQKKSAGRLYDDFRQFWPNASRKQPVVHVQFCDELTGFILTSIEEAAGGYTDPWEISVVDRRVSTFSYFLSYAELKLLLERMDPGTVKGTPWKKMP